MNEYMNERKALLPQGESREHKKHERREQRDQVRMYIQGIQNNI